MSRHYWTPAEDEILRAAYAEGTGAAEIADRIDRTVEAVRHRAIKIGARFNRPAERTTNPRPNPATTRPISLDLVGPVIQRKVEKMADRVGLTFDELATVIRNVLPDYQRGILGKRRQFRRHPDPWIDRARCAEDDVDDRLFHPSVGTSIHEARAVCNACPVRTECLTDAVRNREPYGVWGGTSERERRALRKLVLHIIDQSRSEQSERRSA